MKNILIIGGGYGGLACLRGLSKLLEHKKHSLRLLDASAYHTIKTRFHERAVQLSRDPGIRHRLRPLVAASKAKFIQDEVLGIDYEKKLVEGRKEQYPYDALVLALGGRTAYFDVPGAEEHTVSLQTYEAADRASRRVRELGIGKTRKPIRRAAVCGAGIEGVEVAAMLRQTALSGSLEIAVVDRNERVLDRSQCSEGQRNYVQSFFVRKNIALRLGETV